ncbi:hypothetical protein Pla22_04460 [Rubripirellula amarantea]|uniref:Uncharacterized protein n=1 Tax=Rubripirellula amarantea TaxID=2527999 RepID=A0A5C5WQ46_9BACT|nr:hypothetical protein Pla22_04460 [Rubripirellula amarantea]
MQAFCRQSGIHSYAFCRGYLRAAFTTPVCRPGTLRMAAPLRFGVPLRYVDSKGAEDRIQARAHPGISSRDRMESSRRSDGHNSL